VLYADGDKVEGQVTLNFCGADFASEARRRGRWQVGAENKEGKPVGLSIEAVRYDDDDGSTQALHELRAARQQCPAGFVPSGIAGSPRLKYEFAPTPDTEWPPVDGVDRFAYDARVQPEQGEAYRSLAVYQRRGPFLVGVYLANPDDASVALAVPLPTLVQRIAERLKAAQVSAPS
jgi:hypothetical protein